VSKNTWKDLLLSAEMLIVLIGGLIVAFYVFQWDIKRQTRIELEKQEAIEAHRRGVKERALKEQIRRTIYGDIAK